MRAQGRGRGRGRWSNCGRFWMENTTPQPPQVQPPVPPFQPTNAQGFPPFQAHAGFYPHPFSATFPHTTPPYAFPPMPHNLATAPAQQWVGGSSVPAQMGGQHNGGYGRGSGGYQPRAFFTREHADFIDKLKLKDAVEEARKKDLEEITRLRGLGWEIEQKVKRQDAEKEKTVVEGKIRKQKGKEKEKGKGRIEGDGKEDELKKWVASNFGGSLKILSEKLEEVEKKSGLREAEMEELKMLRAEKELRELREHSSSEKRKRETASPVKLGRGKARSRTNLLKKAGKGKNAKLVEVSSDDESKGKDAVVQNLTGRLDQTVGGNDEVAELKGLIRELLAARGKDAGSSNAGEEQVAKDGNGIERAEQKEEQKEAGPSGEKSGKGKDKDDAVLGLYFKDRVVYYDAMHYTEIQELCKKKGIPYKRKEAGVWELARLDFEVLRKMDETVEEKEEEEEEASEESSESSSGSDEETQNDDIAGN